MFLYACQHQKNIKRRLFLRFILLDEAPRGPHLVGRVLTGLQQPVNELANHLKGWSICGLQTPATCHQLIPGMTKCLLVSKLAQNDFGQS